MSDNPYDPLTDLLNSFARAKEIDHMIISNGFTIKYGAESWQSLYVNLGATPQKDYLKTIVCKAIELGKTIGAVEQKEKIMSSLGLADEFEELKYQITELKEIVRNDKT